MKRSTFRLVLTLALMVCIAMALPGLSASADYVGSYSVGQNIGSVQVFSSESKIQSYTNFAGYLPEGVSLNWNEYGIFMTGAPAKGGDYSASYQVNTEAGISTFIINLSVSGGEEITPAPTQTPKPGSVPYITKHPTGETVEQGGSAQFVARADNATKIIWRLVSRDTTNTVNCADASDYFRGLGVDGLGTERLTLSNIPSELSGWCVAAKFENDYGASYSNGARITVTQSSTGNAGSNTSGSGQNTNTGSNNSQSTNTPTGGTGGLETGASTNNNNGLTTKQANINIQPTSAKLKKGETHTLSVMATSPNTGELSYQWYSAPTANVSALSPIQGATSESYTPTQTEGTMYYCVAVTNTREGVASEPLYSELAELSFEPEATPTPIPTATPTPASGNGSYDRGSSTQIIFFIIIGVLALAALIGVVVYLRIDSRKRGDD